MNLFPHRKRATRLIKLSDKFQLHNNSNEPIASSSKQPVELIKMAPISQRINMKKTATLDASAGNVHERHKRNSLASIHNTQSSTLALQKKKEARGKRSILSTITRWLPWRRANNRTYLHYICSSI